MKNKNFILSSDLFGHKVDCALGEHVALMCPKCFNVVYAKQYGHIHIETEEDGLASGLIIAPLYTMVCWPCDKHVHAVPLEVPIADAVSKFNKKGYTTVTSCCGHREESKPRAFIKFKDKHIFYGLPDTWRQNGVFLESNDDIDKACIDITTWAGQLKESER